MKKVLLNQTHIASLSSSSRAISSNISVNRDQLILDKVDLTLTQKIKPTALWVKPQPITTDGAKYLKSKSLNFNRGGSASVGKKALSTNGRTLLVEYLDAKIIPDKKRSDEISLDNLLTDIEFNHLQALAGSSPVHDWQLIKLVELVEEMKVYLYELAGNTVHTVPNNSTHFSKIDTISGSRYVYQHSYYNFCTTNLFPIRLPQIEFAKDIPLNKSAKDMQADFVRALCCNYGNCYKEKAGKQYSYTWTLPNTNKNRKEKIIIKCYPKGDFIRIEVKFQLIPEDPKILDSAKFLLKLRKYADKANSIINGIQNEMNSNWAYPHYKALENAVFNVLPRSKKDFRVRRLIDTLAKTGAYTPLAENDPVPPPTLNKLVNAGILMKGKQQKFNSIQFTQIPGTKNFFPLAPNWQSMPIPTVPSLKTLNGGAK